MPCRMPFSLVVCNETTKQWHERVEKSTSIKRPHKTSAVRWSCLFQVHYKNTRNSYLLFLPAMPASHTKITAMIYSWHDPSLLQYSKDKALPGLLSSSSINLHMYRVLQSAAVQKKKMSHLKHSTQNEKQFTLALVAWRDISKKVHITTRHTCESELKVQWSQRTPWQQRKLDAC